MHWRPGQPTATQHSACSTSIPTVHIPLPFLQCTFHFHSYLVLFEVGPDPPPLVICQCVSVLLEESVDAGNPSVPGVLQVLKCQSSVLSEGLLSLEPVLRPHTLGVDELALPWLDVAVEIGDELVLFVAHSRPEMRDLSLGLLGPPVNGKTEQVRKCNVRKNGIL